MSNLIALLLSIGFAFSPRGDCQVGELAFFEDASYRITESQNSVVCAIDAKPEDHIAFLAVSYNGETDEITITRFSYVVGSEVSITLLATR